jgi:hypothetical protein
VGEDKSRLRQELLGLEEQRDRQLEFVLDERGPLIRGSLVARKRVCGHPGCRCVTKGRLHVAHYLSLTVGGRTRPIHVPAADQRQVLVRSGRYKRFRRARRLLVELTAKQLKLIDRLGNALLEAYPPGQPIEPAGRRGPKPKKGRNGAR